MRKTIAENRKRIIIIALVLILCIFAAFVIGSTYMHSKEYTLLELLVQDAGEINGISITRISGQEPVEVKCINDEGSISEIMYSLENTLCRYDGRYRYEVFTGGTEYDISFYKEQDGRYIKMSECSISTRGELYYSNCKYIVDESASMIFDNFFDMRGK